MGQVAATSVEQPCFETCLAMMFLADGLKWFGCGRQRWAYAKLTQKHTKTKDMDSDMAMFKALNVLKPTLASQLQGLKFDLINFLELQTCLVLSDCPPL